METETAEESRHVPAVFDSQSDTVAKLFSTSLLFPLFSQVPVAGCFRQKSEH